MTTPYMRFHGRNLSDASGKLASGDGVSESGGGRSITSYSGPGRESSDVDEDGRESTTYSFEMLADDAGRDNLEATIAEINNAPDDVEFYPYSADRCAYVAKAFANRSKAEQYLEGTKLYYTSEATVIARDNRLLGEKITDGLLLKPSLPYSKTLSNVGYYSNTFDYLYMSGGYNNGLTKEVTLTWGDYILSLCDQLMWKDSFKLDRFGNVTHTKETDFPMMYESLQTALGGSGFVDYGTGGGSCGYQAFHMGNNAKLLFPFYGPLPLRSTPTLELNLSSLIGSPIIEYAYNADLSDLIEFDEYVPKAGVNKINGPKDIDGEDLFILGITTDANSSCTVSWAKAEVQRYISEDEMPSFDPGESALVTISDGEYSNHTLEALHFVYRNKY